MHPLHTPIQLMKLNRKTVGIVLAVVAVAGVAAYFMLHGGKSQVQVNFETAKVEKATIGSSITATGTIEAVTTVEVGTQVSGIIDKIYVDYNSHVKRGQVIAELDKTNLVSELNSANSNLQGARSDLNYQQANYNRQRTLFEKGLISANDFESARLALEQAQSVLSQRQEAVNKARTNLGYATITSPIDGIVLSKAVEEGQTVASSFNTPTLFTIVKDMTDMRVIADVDEADIGEVREGQRVTYTVDAYPSEVFQGTVTQVRNEATTTNNVVTYEVVISAPNPDLKLKPGLTANVTVYTLEQPNVVSVPSKALRFTPEPGIIGKRTVTDTDAPHKVWTLEGNAFVAHPVRTGLSDGQHTEILDGISEGTRIVTGTIVSGTTDAAAQGPAPADGERSPFMPKRPGEKSKK